MFERMTLQLENGKQIVIEAEHNADGNRYVQNVHVNNQPHQPLFFAHDQLMERRFIQFEMSDTPKSTDVESKDLPYSMSLRIENPNPTRKEM
jgi:putative alpha-1,2-mannosidase